MQGERIIQTIHIPGTLGADLNILYTTAIPLKLIHVSAVSTAASAATLAIGNTTTAAAYLAAIAVGASGVPNEFDLNDFVGSAYPHMLAGTVMKLAVVYNAGGTAAANLTIVLTFEEG